MSAVTWFLRGPVIGRPLKNHAMLAKVLEITLQVISVRTSIFTAILGQVIFTFGTDPAEI